MPRALVVGGTGPTGPHIVEGLISRGYDTTILHSGRHEVDEISGRVRHLHTNAYDRDALDTALHGETYDLAVVTYGRLRDVASLLRGRVGRFLSVGAFAAYRGAVTPDPDAWPPGTRVPLRETSATVEADSRETTGKLANIARTERAVFEAHPLATHFRYAMVYGPRHPRPFDWMIVRRALDRRRHIVLPEGGLTLRSRIYAPNAASALMCALDHPDESAGEIFNASDSWTPTLAQLVGMIGRALEHEFEIISMPYELATPSHPMLLHGDAGHRVIPHDKLLHQLGFREPIPPEKAVIEATRWLVDNPPTTRTAAALGDPFDYRAEDRLIRAWRTSTATLVEAAAAANPKFLPRYAPAFDRQKARTFRLND